MLQPCFIVPTCSMSLIHSSSSYRIHPCCIVLHASSVLHNSLQDSPLIQNSLEVSSLLHSPLNTLSLILYCSIFDSFLCTLHTWFRRSFALLCIFTLIVYMSTVDFTISFLNLFNVYLNMYSNVQTMDKKQIFCMYSTWNSCNVFARRKWDSTFENIAGSLYCVAGK